MEPTGASGSEVEGAAPARSARRLWLYGLAMLLPAAYFAGRYPLRGNTGSLLEIGRRADYSVEEFVWFLLGGGALFVLYTLAVLESRRLPTRRALPAVFGCGALLVLVFAWMYPATAIDVFIYAVHSRIWTEYGENPHEVLPVAYWDTDPYVRFALRVWADDPSPYGPLWNVVAAPATLLGGDDIGVAVVVFKVLAAACVLGCGVVIAKTLHALRPADAATGALVFLWNPLVLWEGVANAHNDVLLALLLLLAILAWARRWDGLVVPILVVAALIKYVGVLFLPLAAVALWRRTQTWRERRLVAIESAALSALAVLVGFAPFFDVRAVIGSIERQGELIGMSPPWLTISLLEDRFAQPDLTDTVKAIGVGIVLLALGWQLVNVWTKPERLPRAGFEVLAIFLLVAAWWFRSWYLVWPTALVALLPLGWPFWRTLAWTATGLLGYGHYVWIWQWWRPDIATSWTVGVLVTFTPVVLLSLAEFVGRFVPHRPPKAIGKPADALERRSAPSA